MTALDSVDTESSNVHGKKQGAALGRLARPFKCPGSARPTRSSERPSRKRQKLSYADSDTEETEKTILGVSDINKWPTYKVKNKDETFRQKFSIPLKNKLDATQYEFRTAPPLGMRLGAVFVARPLHDPSGEFSIVLYDPTVDDVKTVSSVEPEAAKELTKPVVDEPIVHKSLANILGIKKNLKEHPRVPVVIDPRLAKVLRPHQVEGVKVQHHLLGAPWYEANMA